MLQCFLFYILLYNFTTKKPYKMLIFQHLYGFLFLVPEQGAYVKNITCKSTLFSVSKLVIAINYEICTYKCHFFAINYVFNLTYFLGLAIHYINFFYSKPVMIILTHFPICSFGILIFFKIIIYIIALTNSTS